MSQAARAEIDKMLARGLEFFQAGQSQDAEKVLARLVRRDPANAVALHVLGLIAFQQQDSGRALKLISQAIALRPDEAATYNNRATMRLALGEFDQAIADGDAAIQFAPHIADYHVTRASALQAAGQLEAAAAGYEAAIALAPRNAVSHRGLGNALYGLGEFERALLSYDAAIELQPDASLTHYNRGAALKVLGRAREALDSFEIAGRLNPNFAVAHHNRALSLLHMGDLAAGFREYEWRKRCPSFDDPRYAEPRQWLGVEPLAGKTLFVYPEFYQGDLIQFCRYARSAERMGARVVLSAPVAMHRLLQTLSPTVELLATDAAAPTFDYQTALLSLPLAFGTTLESLPEDTSYLQAEAPRVERWRARIGAHGFKVGVVWQGSTLPYAIPLQRSYPLAALQGLSQIDGVRLISLQKVNGLDQLATLPTGMKVETLGEDFDDGADAFLDTAAAMACCDLLIVMDTSVAHLAGALGLRTWVALPFIADWRWLADRADSPWYPSLRLFRQGERNDWDSVFSAMAELLRAERTGAAPDQRG